ncbi:MAG: cyclin-like protein [Olpidium bornovanus]|uniref:Cyclin-like protein n=1 Tax=Olpidium bornovanus TaxID=278681 RepID=A0A8H7ZTL5_9FUNG|nr:MAG: cyclin-like protein [Olpidium bornovanus]
MMPNPAYCELQKDINHRMRDVLLDWMVEVHQSFKMIPETLYLAINILDRYLSLIQVPSNTLQLAGITALFIAAKVEEIAIPEIKEFAYMADNAYSLEEIRRAERHVLQKINFRLSYPNPMNFLRRISKADDYDTLSRTVGKYLLEIAIVDHRFMGFAPSLIAAGAMYLARHILNKGIWVRRVAYLTKRRPPLNLTPFVDTSQITVFCCSIAPAPPPPFPPFPPTHRVLPSQDATLAHYAGYDEEDILPVVSLMVVYISEPIHESLYKKYAGKKFSKVSVRVHEWYQSRKNGRQ